MLDEDTKELARVVLDACQDIKGKNIIGLDLSEHKSYTDFVVIVSGNTERQNAAIADQILKKVFEHCQLHPLGKEGYEAKEWMLIDFGHVIIHIFNEDVREEYHLEDMWIDLAPIAEEQLSTYLKSA